MGYANFPPNPPYSNFRDAALRHLRTVLARIFRRSQGFLNSKRLPYTANKVCQTYFGQANPTHLAGCRRVLRSRLTLNPNQLQHFLQTGVGTCMLRWLEPFFQVSDEIALQDLILQVAADPEGLSLLSFLQCNPDLFRVNLDHLLLTANRVSSLLQATDKAIAAIKNLSTAETLMAGETDFSDWADFQQPGPFEVKQFQLVVERGQQEDLSVFCYYPQGCLHGSIPVVIQSHGLASSPEDLAEYALHLASYGYFVAAPQHKGSDIDHAREMLAGRSPHVFAPSDFVHRPQDVSILLDELERCNQTQFEGRLNLKAVGVLGYSFGSYTAFALGGAEIDFEKLASACDRIQHLNTSLLLQCQALELPRSSYSLRDPRIQAILAMEPLGSELFGSQGIRQIQVPVLLIAGSHDLVTPLIWEQARIFLWLTSPHRYLAVMQGKSHLRDAQRLVQQLDLQISLSPQQHLSSPSNEPLPFDSYIKALSLTFFNQHLQPSIADFPLSAAYAASLNRSPHHLWLISDRSSHQLHQDLQQIHDELLVERDFGMTSNPV
ncbi:alpha/beta hydrolase [Oscillatoria sp. FACHB-1407]|uniref:alpha/beta hydrolase n=1 Tax=Oscillatoria sp. FACHB-1407 TaxID=2692847 RepID=UPI001686862F|nr:alpha/beta hydrolase [Oscillatoria sp. FACHB-1407]MBD2463640.1 alpha/beta hydrolase [Oscillatoria sp. FACHB-1407]